MNNINCFSQYIRNNKTFAEIASNAILSKINQAIVFNSINNIKQTKYFTAISINTPAENIADYYLTFISCISC